MKGSGDGGEAVEGPEIDGGWVEDDEDCDCDCCEEEGLGDEGEGRGDAYDEAEILLSRERGGWRIMFGQVTFCTPELRNRFILEALQEVIYTRDCQLSMKVGGLEVQDE